MEVKVIQKDEDGDDNTEKCDMETDSFPNKSDGLGQFTTCPKNQVRQIYQVSS